MIETRQPSIYLEQRIIGTVVGNLRAVVLEVWSLDQQHLHHLEPVRNAFLGSTPDLLNQGLEGRGPAVCILLDLRDGSIARSSVRTIALV